MAFIYSFTDLWNAGGTTFDAIKVDVTDTASAAASLLLNLSVGGVVKFSVRKDGHVVAATEAIGGATIGTNALAVTGTGIISGNFAFANANTFIGNGSANGGADSIWIKSGGTFDFGIYSGSIRSRATAVYGWTSNTIDLAYDTNISRQAFGVIQFGTTAANAAGAWLAAKGTLTGGTLADQAQVLSVTATQPASPSAFQSAVLWTITGAGSANQLNAGFFLNYAAGYTGVHGSAGMIIDNVNAGLGNTTIPANGNNFPTANWGFGGQAYATTVGTNIGALGRASGGNVSAGVVGLSQIAKNSATNIGGVFSGINTGTSSVQIGALACLNQTTVPTVSAALIADNGAQTDAIFLARDNGSTVFTIADGGAMTTTGRITALGGAVFLVTSTALTDGVGASAGTITNAPSIGNPTKWIGINDNGTTRYIPAW